MVAMAVAEGADILGLELERITVIAKHLRLTRLGMSLALQMNRRLQGAGLELLDAAQRCRSPAGLGQHQQCQQGKEETTHGEGLNRSGRSIASGSEADAGKR